nr:hypothetical protein Iba_chr11eCG15010 [Ipomoea batatas]
MKSTDTSTSTATSTIKTNAGITPSTLRVAGMDMIPAPMIVVDTLNTARHISSLLSVGVSLLWSRGTSAPITGDIPESGEYGNELIGEPEDVWSKFTRMSALIDSPNRRYPKIPIVKYRPAQSSSEILTAEAMTEVDALPACVNLSRKSTETSTSTATTTVKTNAGITPSTFRVAGMDMIPAPMILVVTLNTARHSTTLLSAGVSLLWSSGASAPITGDIPESGENVLARDFSPAPAAVASVEDYCCLHLP